MIVGVTKGILCAVLGIGGDKSVMSLLMNILKAKSINTLSY